MNTLRNACRILALALLAQAAAAGTITVTDNDVAGSQLGSGSTCTLRQAIYAANAANGVTALQMNTLSSAGACGGATAGSTPSSSPRHWRRRISPSVRSTTAGTARMRCRPSPARS